VDLTGFQLERNVSERVNPRVGLEEVFCGQQRHGVLSVSALTTVTSTGTVVGTFSP